MRISGNGIRFIKKWENFSEIPYKNSEKEKYYSIGYSHYGPDVKLNSKVNEEEATKLLIKDLHKYEGRVAKYNKIYNFTQIQFDALVSFCFQCGSIDNLTNYGTNSIEEIARNMVLYCKFCGKISKKLISRRKAEKNMILKG